MLLDNSLYTFFLQIIHHVLLRFIIPAPACHKFCILGPFSITLPYLTNTSASHVSGIPLWTARQIVRDGTGSSLNLGQSCLAGQSYHKCFSSFNWCRCKCQHLDLRTFELIFCNVAFYVSAAHIYEKGTLKDVLYSKKWQVKNQRHTFYLKRNRQ